MPHPRVLRDTDADPGFLREARVGVVGFGNQGQAQALCLRDSGINVQVFTRPGGPSEVRARALGFEPAAAEAAAECAVLALLVPDEAQDAVQREFVEPYARRGSLLVYAHGFALRHGAETPRADLDLAIVGPLGPGALLRSRYEQGTGLAGLLAVVRDGSGSAERGALAYAHAVGLTRAGLLPTTLDEEVVSDLFAEQVVLCGGVPELIRAAWSTLVADGISEEIAFYSCVQELKQILDLVHAEGLAGMRARISGTAQYGGLTRGPRIIGPEARKAMKDALEQIRDGSFAEEWTAEQAGGAAELARMRSEEAEHPMEEAGRRVRRGLSGVPDPPAESGGGVDSPHPEN
ncbi:MAG: ketol-acid reductoisomerase [Gemmatimonadetes bacterium]|nr:ketol-acid reductoisomerase [Gemmatimonadota bacterium]